MPWDGANNVIADVERYRCVCEKKAVGQRSQKVLLDSSSNQVPGESRGLGQTTVNSHTKLRSSQDSWTKRNFVGFVQYKKDFVHLQLCQHPALCELSPLSFFFLTTL